MRRVGFTGTQHGMSDAQKDFLRELLHAPGTELHHGDCVGADEEADEIARSLGCKIVVHPPSDPKKRAFCAQPGDTVWEERHYLERNVDIVDATRELVAAPLTDREQLRSGTWATVRYARKTGRKVTVLPR